jgi:hypothetical protein
MTARNSTISYNYGDYGGGVSSFNSTVDLINTIVADNGPIDLARQGLAGGFELAFSLVEWPSTVGVTESVLGSNIIGEDPQLGPLMDSGGQQAGPALEYEIPELAIPVSSPAVDCGASQGATTDQRGTGFQRPIDLPGRANSTLTGADGADIGAFELQSGSPTGACTNNIPPPSTGTIPGTHPAPAPTFNLKAAIKKCKKRFAKSPKRKKCIKKAKAGA